jgi:hypothetical protein
MNFHIIISYLLGALIFGNNKTHQFQLRMIISLFLSLSVELWMEKQLDITKFSLFY